MNKLRRINTRIRSEPTPEPLYGPDPGDASVEHAYLEVQDEIRLGIINLRTYPNEGPREKERFLAKAIAPRSRALRVLLIIVFAVFKAGTEPTRRRTRKE